MDKEFLKNQKKIKKIMKRSLSREIDQPREPTQFPELLPNIVNQRESESPLIEQLQEKEIEKLQENKGEDEVKGQEIKI